MWLQRVLFNVQTRILGKNGQAASKTRASQSATVRRQAKRVQVFEDRLSDLDSRMANLQLQTNLK
jgi:hypothetical protein